MENTTNCCNLTTLVTNTSRRLSDNVSSSAAMPTLAQSALASLDATWIAYLLWIVLNLVGIVGNAFILVVFRTDQTFRSNHYFLVTHLALSNGLACIKNLSEALRRLIEWGTRSPVLFSKLICVLVFPQIGDVAAKWLHLLIAIDRIVAMEFAVWYRQTPRSYVWLLAGFAWAWGIVEHGWQLGWAAYENGPLPLCLPSLILNTNTLNFTIQRDIVLSVSYVVCYAALVVLFQLSLYKAGRQGNQAIRQAKKEIQPKIIKAQVIDAAFTVLTFCTSSTVRELYVNRSSPQVKLVTTPYIGLLLQLTNVSNIFIYCAVNSNFWRAFKKTILKQSAVYPLSTSSVGITVLQKA